MNKQILTFAALTLIAGGILLAPQIASAYQGNPNIKGPNYSQERHTAMEKAFETNDYNAWKNLMQNRGRVTQIINEKNFAKFAEAHRLAEAGKLQEAAKIRLELGLGNGANCGNGMGRNKSR